MHQDNACSSRAPCADQSLTVQSSLALASSPRLGHQLTAFTLPEWLGRTSRSASVCRSQMYTCGEGGAPW